MPELPARPAPGTAERPLRVVVLGSSTVFMVVPGRRHPDDAVYGELLAELLAARGVTATVSVRSRWHATVRELLPRFEQDVRDAFPDVVVVNLGMAEAQARVLPTWLVRHTMTWLPGSSDLAAAYRRRVVPRLHRVVREVQRALVPHVGLRASRVPPRVFVRSMRRLVTLCTRDLGALVLLLDIDPPGERVEHWLPGLGRRVAAYNDLLQQVADADPRALLLRTSSVVAEHGHDAALPDGLHRSALGHALVARQVADAVLAHAPALGRSR